MNGRTTAITVFSLLCATCVAHAIWYYPRLPEVVAQHFNASGQPDAWGVKANFLTAYLVAVGVVAVTFLGLGLLLSKIPDGAINLPNKDYWLAPEQRQKTLDSLLSPMLWFGSLTMLLLLDIFHQSFQVNLGQATKLNHAGISTGAYLLATAAWLVAFYRRFRKKES